jgi:hypothetical protein
MSDWSVRLAELAAHAASYRPGDFLMFAPRIYWRMFELHNQAWWPLPVLLPWVGLVLAAWVGRGSVLAARAGGLVLAAACVFVAVAFVRERYVPINSAADGVAWLLFGLAVLLCVLAIAVPAWPSATDTGRDADRRARRAGALLAAWALLGQPLVAPLAGRPLAQAEVVGLAPDPTLFAVLAWLLWIAGQGAVVRPSSLRWAWRLAFAGALLACLAAAATLATMEEAAAAVPLVAALLALEALRRLRRRSVRGDGSARIRR